MKYRIFSTYVSSSLAVAGGAVPHLRAGFVARTCEFELKSRPTREVSE